MKKDFTYKKALLSCDYMGKVCRSCKGTVALMTRNNMMRGKKIECTYCIGNRESCYFRKSKKYLRIFFILLVCNK